MRTQKSLALSTRSIFMACCLLAMLALMGIQAQPASAEDMAFVRLVHASPDVGTVDVFVDGNKLLSNFQYDTVTSYLPLPAGTHKIQIALIGKGANAAITDQTLSVSPGIPYTIAALGTKSTGLSLAIFTDNNSIANNTAKLRVYHLSPGTGSVNVSTDTNSIIHELSYPQASGYIALPAGTHTFTVTLPTTNTTLPVTTTLKSWTVTSVFAIGLLKGHPKLQIITSQTTGMPGMPGTGSDPTPLPNHPQTLSPWLLAISGVLICMLLIVVASRHWYQEA